MDKLRITVFADPACTWCWGSVPVLRAIEYRLGKQTEINYVMGGMIEDIRSFANRRLNIGGDIALSNRNMLKAWSEASAIHGMPVIEQGFHLFSEKHPSTFPQNIAYISAKEYCKHEMDEKFVFRRANRYLRRIQEATAVEGMQTCIPEVLTGLAAVEGFEPEKFNKFMYSDEVKKNFAADRTKAEHYDVKSFPAFLLEYDGHESILKGYSTYDVLVQEINTLTKNRFSDCLAKKNDENERCAPTAENVKHFIEHYKSVYPVEIATVFSLPRINGKSAVNIESYELLPDLLDELLKQGCSSMAPIGNSFKIFNLKRAATKTQEHERDFYHIHN